MNTGTAPAWMTMRVWELVPEAMLVRAQAASNCHIIDQLFPRIMEAAKS